MEIRSIKLGRSTWIDVDRRGSELVRFEGTTVNPGYNDFQIPLCLIVVKRLSVYQEKA